MRITASDIILNNLRFHAFHGVEAQERLTGNDYSLSIRISCPLAQAAQSDNVRDTINYAEAYELVRQEMQTPSALVEHVAYRIGQQLFTAFPQATAIDICLLKLNPPMGADCDGAGVQLHLINDKTT